MTEAEIRVELNADLNRLGIPFAEEVWMLCWTHSMRAQADRLRIDYVICLDGRLIGIETKGAPEQAADLGRYLFQCAQYASGKIGVNSAEVPNDWIGRPLDAVMLRTKINRNDQFMVQHLFAASRLYGAANVGFLVKEPRGLCMRLCGERFWTEWRGFHQGMLNKAVRVGNSSRQVGK